MLATYIIFSISIATISWLVGIVFNSILLKTKYYDSLSNLNFIRNEKLNERIGIGTLKWIVINTPFRFFNPGLKLTPKADHAELLRIRKEMTKAEIGHLIGFGFVTVVALLQLTYGKFLLVFVIMLMNTLMNLYPSLLQQANKRRMDRVIEIMNSRS